MPRPKTTLLVAKYEKGHSEICEQVFGVPTGKSSQTENDRITATSKYNGVEVRKGLNSGLTLDSERLFGNLDNPREIDKVDTLPIGKGNIYSRKLGSTVCEGNHEVAWSSNVNSVGPGQTLYVGILMKNPKSVGYMPRL